MDSARGGQAETPDDHQHPRELSESEMPVPPEDDTRSEEDGGQDELGAAEQGQARAARGSRRYYRKRRKAEFARGPQKYYTTLYSQFTNVVMVSAFMGGLEAAILSFQHDILSDGPAGKQLFRQEEDSVKFIYSSYSMGLMLGLLSISLSLTTAIVAAVNATLACHLSLHTKSRPVLMEERVALCILIQFLGLACAVVSLLILCSLLSLTFTFLITALLLSGVCLSFYHALSASGLTQWAKGPSWLPSLSILVSLVVLMIDIMFPSETSSVTIGVAGFTIAHHVWRGPALAEESAPRPMAAILMLAGFWATLIIDKLLGFARPRKTGWIHKTLASTYLLLGLAAVECLLLLWYGLAGYIRGRRRSHSTQSEEHNGVAP